MNTNDGGGGIVASYVWALVFVAGAVFCTKQDDDGFKLLGLILFAMAAVLFVGATLKSLFVSLGFICRLLLKAICLLLTAGLYTVNANETGTLRLAKSNSRFFRFYVYRKLVAGMMAAVIAVAGMLAVHQLGSRTRQWLFAVPLLVALFVFRLPNWIERVQASSWYVRQFRTGGKPNEDFPSNFVHRKKAQSFSSIYDRRGGYKTDKRYLGETLFESTGKPQHLWTSDCAGEITYACIGAGKSASDLFISAINSNSKVYISTKGELADTLLGANCDPSWHDPRASQDDRHPGVDARGITKVEFYVPGSRAFVCDPADLSVFEDSGYPFLHEIDPAKPDEAVALIAALAMALAVENERASDPFWQKNTRKFIKSGMLHVVTTFPKHKRTLPAVADFLLGIDPESGVASPKIAEDNLKAMMNNSAFGGLIQAGAAQILQLGERVFGAINAGMGDALECLMSPMLRKHLSKPPTWSYREFGCKATPLNAFIVPPNLDIDARNTFMRCHAAMSTSLFATRPSLPDSPILFFGDEFPQYGAGSGIAEKSLVLRAARVKLILFGQSYSAMEQAIGRDKMEMLASSSTERFYGCNDIQTARRLVDYCGQRMADDGRAYEMVSVQDIMRELDVSSNLMYVKPYAGPVMRLRRRGYKTIRAETGLHLRGLPLQGHYDDTLSKIK